jgi:hypothetical protein
VLTLLCSEREVAPRSSSHNYRAMARSISRDSDLRQNRLAKGDSRHQSPGVGYQFCSRFGMATAH